MSLLKFFWEKADWIHCLLATVFLPIVWSRDSVDVLREYSKFLRDLPKVMTYRVEDEVIFNDAQHIFTLEIWYYVAVAILLAGIFAAGEGIRHANDGTYLEAELATARSMIYSFGVLITSGLVLLIKAKKRKSVQIMLYYGFAIYRGER